MGRSLVVFATLLMLLSIPTARAQVEFNLQVGAIAENGSIGNVGVRAQIRTHIYDVSKPDLADAFWVGNNMENGSFIQFGYILQPGPYCLTGKVVGDHINCRGRTEVIGVSDARWFWEYWPNASNPIFYFDTGPNQSAGAEGSWHSYEIEPNQQNGWSFILDGQQIDNFSVHWARSKDPAYMVAEKVTLSPVPGTLGPVEFRSLAYLEQDGWHNATALYALVGCGVNPVCIQNPYGVAAESANEIVAGSGESQPNDRELLWTVTRQQQLASQDYAVRKTYGATAILILIGGLLAAIVITSNRKRKPSNTIPSLLGYCVNCGVQLEPYSLFCTNCGARREQG